MSPPIEQTESSNQLALQMRGISKSFGPVPVLKKVDFELRAGEIHALMGENGAGKTTLMKIAAGLIDDFEGEIYVGGTQHRMASPRDAARAGIAMIQQELSLVPELAVVGIRSCSHNCVWFFYWHWSLFRVLPGAAGVAAGPHRGAAI